MTASADYYSDDVTAKAKLLSELEVIEEITDETKLDESVTRRDFIIAAAKMMGIDTYRVNDTRYYRDMTSDDLAWNAANTLLEMGILTTNEEQMFRPDDVIKRNEAASVLVKMLGFRGFDYESTISVANSIDLMKGVSTPELKLRDMLCVLTNTLNAYMFEAEGTISIDYTVKQGDETFMEEYFDMFHIEGIVNEVNDTSLIDSKGNGKNTICIGDTVLNTAEGSDYYDYLGGYASAYYTDIEDTYTLISISLREGKTERLVIEAEDIEEFDPELYVLRYRQDTHIKTLKINKGANIVVNGENVSSGIEEAFNSIVNGRVTLIESDNSTGYETVIISTYCNITVQYVDAANMKIYGTHNEIIPLEDDNIEYVITTAGGEMLDFSDIAKNNVISYYSSSDLNRLVVSSSSVTGNIDRVQKDDDTTYITVAGVEYKVDRHFFDKTDMVLSLGSGVVCYIDAYGVIADVKTERNSNGTYAWVVNCFWEEYDPDTVFLKVFTENGEMLRLAMAANTRIDGYSCKTGSDKRAKLNTNGSEKDQLVLIELNDEGEIKSIDTTKEGSAQNGLFESSPEAENYFYAGQMLLGPTIQLESTSKLFIVPSSNKYKGDDDAYQVVSGNTFFKDWELYKVTGYRTGSQDGVDFTEAMVLKTDLKGTNGFYTINKNVFIVVDTREVYDDESGEIREEIDLLSGKTTATYMSAAGYSFENDSDIKVGNVVRITNNSRGEVTSAELVYGEDSSGEMYDGSGNIAWGTRDQSEVGYIKALENGLLALSLEKDGETALIVKTANIAVGVYDPSKREPVYAGGEEDLIEAYNEGYKIVIDISRGVVRAFSVIKK